jgi:O-antigen/teichoic acid export membrane protein
MHNEIVLPAHAHFAMVNVLKLLSRNNVYQWGFRGLFSILDQGLFSGANFLMSIFLARWLEPVGYGTFSLAFAVYLFLSGFYNAIILEPMSVFGTGKYFDYLEDYLSNQLIIHVIFCGLLSVIVIIVGGIMLLIKQVDHQLSLAILGMGVFIPFMFMMWLARRSCYVYGKPAWAFWASLVYAIVLLGSLFFISIFGLGLNIFLIFFAMGLASLAGSGVVYRLMRVTFIKIFRNHFSWQSLLIEQWLFSRWIMLAAVFNSAATQIQLFITAALLGLYAAGVLSALQNFMLPMMQIVTVIATLGLPSISFEFGKKNYSEMKRKGFKISLLLFLFSVIYLVLLALTAPQLERLLYGGKYAEFAWLLPVIGFIPVLAAIEAGYSIIIRALRRPSYHAVWTGSIALIGISSGWFLVSNYKIIGAIFSLLSVAVISLIVNIWFYQVWFVVKISSKSKVSE